VSKHASKMIAILIPIVVLLLIIFAVYQQITGMTGGVFLYALDDAYIHMSMADSFARAGVWGVTPYEFTSATSSPLWTFLLGVSFWLAGSASWLPLLLNTLFALGILLLVYALLHWQGLPGWAILITALLLIFIAPLPTLISTGMEHTLQILLAVALVSLGAYLLAVEPFPGWESNVFRGFIVLVLLQGLIRYENLFLVAAICLLFLLRGRWRLSFILGGLAFVPIIAYGLFSVSQGSFFLPSSVLIKTHLAESTVAISSLNPLKPFIVMSNVKIIPALMLPLVVLLVLHRLNPRTRGWDYSKAFALITLIALLLHIQLAQLGWLFRYEAYLIALAIIGQVLLLGHWLRYLPRQRLRSWGLLVALMFVVTGGFYIQRANDALQAIQPATQDIYWQHYQMGQFLAAYYPASTVAANDIGMMNYLTDIRNIDLVGLATTEAAAARLENRFDRAFVEAVTQATNTEIALLYDDWFPDQIPLEWQKVGEWRVSTAFIAGGTVISFYAVDLAQEQPLRDSLNEYAPLLPSTVEFIPFS